MTGPNLPMPLRIAHVMGKMSGGGVESFVMNFYRAIDRTKVQFDFIVDEDSQLVPENEINALGGRVFSVPSYKSVFRYQSALRKLFSDEKWTIVHSHLNALSVFPLMAAKHEGVPVRIAHSHSAWGKGEPVRNAAKAVLRRFSNLYPTHRFACSAHAGVWLFGKKSNFSVIHNAIELESFRFNEENRDKVRARYGIDESAFVIGSVGRLVSTKNQSFLLEVFCSVKERVPEAMLLIAGDGNLREGLERKAQASGLGRDVVFAGNVKDIHALYSAFDVFALPSLYEGLGLVCIEAQCNGLDCCVSDRVPSEAQLVESVTFLPLGMGVDPWVQSLASSRGKKRAATKMSPGAFREYDIHAEARKLEETYLRLDRDCASCELG